VGVPLIVIVLDDHEAVTPAGRPLAVPIPVAPVVVCVIGVKTVLTHSAGLEEAAPTVFSGVTLIVPVAVVLPHPPVRGIL
jgi:hypothetical protein